MPRNATNYCTSARHSFTFVSLDKHKCIVARLTDNFVFGCWPMNRCVYLRIHSICCKQYLQLPIENGQYHNVVKHYRNACSFASARHQTDYSCAGLTNTTRASHVGRYLMVKEAANWKRAYTLLLVMLVASLVAIYVVKSVPAELPLFSNQQGASWLVLPNY